MAAGDEVVKRIEAELLDIVASGPAHAIERARSNIYLVLHGAMRSYLAEAAVMLAERDRMDRSAAHADVEGHLVDLHEVLQNLV